MKALIRLTIQGHMDIRSSFEHRLIDATNLEKSLADVKRYIEYWNARGADGMYSNEIKVLTQMEALQFANSLEVNPDRKDELIETIRNNYYNDHLYDPDPDEPWWHR